MAYIAKSPQIDHQIKACARLKTHLNVYSTFEVLDFNDAAGKVFEKLRKVKLRVGTADLKIASIALSQDATLISRNLRDFSGIPNLDVFDWTKP